MKNVQGWLKALVRPASPELPSPKWLRRPKLQRGEMASKVACQEKINSAKSAPVLLTRALSCVLNVRNSPAKLPNKVQSLMAIANILQGKKNNFY